MTQFKSRIIVAMLIGVCAGSFGQATISAGPQPGATTETYSALLIQILPALTVPLGESSTYFSLGGGVQVGAEYRFRFFPSLFALGSLGYDLAPLKLSGQSASFPNAILGAGLQFQVTPWLVIKSYVAGGYQYGFLNNAGTTVASGNPCVIAGAGAQFPIAESFSLEAGGTYRYFAGSYNGIGAYVGTAMHLLPEEIQRGAREEKRVTPPIKEIPKPLSISAISALQFNPVFAVMRKYYDNHSIGQIEVKNSNKTTIKDLTVTLLIRKYMDAPRKCAELKELKPDETKTIDLSALFNDSMLDITEETKVTAEVTCSYTQNGASISDSDSRSVRVYGRNSMTWDDNNKACAFVTAKDPAVLTFSNNVNSFVKPRMNPAVNKKLQAALAIHEALRLYGLSYVSNAISYADVSQNKETVDYLKFPRQTFEYRSGDCSDLSILYCALLESMQVETAFITIPGHIFMAINLDATPEEAKKVFTSTDNLIFRDNATWLPIEVTQRSGDFLVAWAEGGKEWRENSTRQQADFFPIRAGWKVYESVQYPGSSTINVPSEEKIGAAFEDVSNRFVMQQITASVAQLQAKIRASNNSPKALNDLGLLYARYGLYDNAARQFNQILSATEYVPALVNMGNISFIKRDMDSALQYFDRANRKDPKNAPALVGLARANQETENYGAVKKYYGLLKTVDPNLAQQFAYLELRGEESTRAAEVSGANEVIIWAEK
jgi:tetratricopeptide (TPR) repeat protein